MRFVESEYAVPRASLVPVITELRRWIDAGDERIGIPIEIRSAAADDLWLSTGYRRENAYVAVHHYWRQDPTRYFAAFEAIVAEHAGRPHWDKSTPSTPTDSGNSIPGSTTSWPSGTAWIRAGVRQPVPGASARVLTRSSARFPGVLTTRSAPLVRRRGLARRSTAGLPSGQTSDR